MSDPKRIERMYCFVDGELIVDQTDSTLGIQNNAEQGFGNLGSGYFTIGTGQTTAEVNALIPKKGMEQDLVDLVTSQKLCVMQFRSNGKLYQSNGIWSSADLKSDPKSGMQTGNFKFIGDATERVG